MVDGWINQWKHNAVPAACLFHALLFAKELVTFKHTPCFGDFLYVFLMQNACSTSAGVLTDVGPCSMSVGNNRGCHILNTQ